MCVCVHVTDSSSSLIDTLFISPLSGFLHYSLSRSSSRPCSPPVYYSRFLSLCLPFVTSSLPSSTPLGHHVSIACVRLFSSIFFPSFLLTSCFHFSFPLLLLNVFSFSFSSPSPNTPSVYFSSSAPSCFLSISIQTALLQLFLILVLPLLSPVCLLLSAFSSFLPYTLLQPSSLSPLLLPFFLVVTILFYHLPFGFFVSSLLIRPPELQQTPRPLLLLFPSFHRSSHKLQEQNAPLW